MPIAASKSAKARAALLWQPVISKPDGDNIEKLVMDAIHPAGNADKGRWVGVLEEDSRVAAMHRTKLYGAIPGLFLSIAPWHVPLPTIEDAFGAEWATFSQDFFV